MNQVKLDEQRTALVEHQCQQLILRSIKYFDEHNWSSYADLFAEDGLLIQASQPDISLQGRAAIVEELSRRSPDRLTRHICTNIVIEVFDGNNAEGLCYLLLYAADGSKPANATGRVVNSPRRVGEYRDKFIRTDDGWKIAERRGVLLFYTE